jgi:hypothetical protein
MSPFWNNVTGFYFIIYIFPVGSFILFVFFFNLSTTVKPVDFQWVNVALKLFSKPTVFV